jgi:hypothetical protein
LTGDDTKSLRLDEIHNRLRSKGTVAFKHRRYCQMDGSPMPLQHSSRSIGLPRPSSTIYMSFHGVPGA